jgi:hypothetical protein
LNGKADVKFIENHIERQIKEIQQEFTKLEKKLKAFAELTAKALGMTDAAGAAQEIRRIFQ